ncbi:restriction endonuclease [Roseovarius sp. S1116L3]|uniref:restriction endonuclease n=1 Tax=Roseovarius roseus TaxID=3342636 RepID=UPI00372C7C1B
MPVPDYQTLMLPVLKLFGSGKTSVAECIEDLKIEFEISDEDAAELLPSGKMTRLYNRAHWARTYLGKAGLLTSPKRGHHEITALGKAVLAKDPDRIGNADLSQFDGFSDWKDQPATKDGLGEDCSADRKVIDQTPEDAMMTASRVIEAALREELIGAVMQVSPTRFERLILDLLSAMNFGRGDLDNSRMTPGSGDGGIDGIINEDALGLDAVYIQAKRYAPDNKVGRPDIQRFVGSLTGESATKGVFVTTSSFSKEARDYISRVQQRIVLIDGDKLAQLMIAHDVGVRKRSTYYVRSLDEDYFSDI